MEGEKSRLARATSKQRIGDLEISSLFPSCLSPSILWRELPITRARLDSILSLFARMAPPRRRGNARRSGRSSRPARNAGRASSNGHGNDHAMDGHVCGPSCNNMTRLAKRNQGQPTEGPRLMPYQEIPVCSVSLDNAARPRACQWSDDGHLCVLTEETLLILVSGGRTVTGEAPC